MERKQPNEDRVAVGSRDSKHHIVLIEHAGTTFLDALASKCVRLRSPECLMRSVGRLVTDSLTWHESRRWHAS